MSPFSHAGLLIVDTLFGLAMFVLVLRILLQVIRANFYNPICQVVWKLTNPVLGGWQRYLPTVRNVPLAAVLLCMLLAIVWAWVTGLVAGTPVSVGAIAVYAIGRLIGFVISFFFWMALARVILSWFSPDTSNPAIPILYAIADLVLKPFRRIIPLVGGIDISPIFALLSLQLANILVTRPLLNFASQLG